MRARHAVHRSANRPRGVGHRVRRGFALMALPILMSWMGVAPPAEAQCDDAHVQRLEERLRMTDEALERAAEIVRAAESERAFRLLHNAREMQQKAWHLFESCEPPRECRPCAAAAEATVRAQRGARQAIQVAREQSSQEHHARRAIEIATELLEQAYQALRAEDTHNPQALRLLEQAKELIERARERLREREFAAATALAESAARVIRQALHLGEDGDLNPERVKRQLERTQELLERARAVIGESDHEGAHRLFQRAVELQERALRAFESEHYLMALRLTRESRQFAHRALGMVTDGPVRVEMVERAIQQTDRLIARAEPVIRESGSEHAAQLFRVALEHQAKAKERLADGQLRSALAQTRVARNLVHEAVEAAGSGDGPTL